MPDTPTDSFTESSSQVRRVYSFLYFKRSSLTVKNLPAMQETKVQSLGPEDPLDEGMATHSSILVWRTPWIKEAGMLQSIVSQRVRHDGSDLACMRP